MARKLPPLNALKAFEAAGRHLSFARAADELHVTPAAVSHQVKALEEILGLRLFRRLPRGLLLTDAGQTCLPALTRSFDGLAAAVEGLQQRRQDASLTVSVMPSLAAKRLLPLLPDFQRLHPDIELHVSATTRSVDFSRDGADVAIRYGRGNWPGLRTVLLSTEVLFPVCSPALRQGPRPLENPADLRHHTLLHDQSLQTDFPGAFPDWGAWLAAAGVDEVDPSRGVGLAPSNMVFDAAVAGQGVALGRSVLVATDLAEGRLVKPFGPTLALDYAYYLVCPEASFDRPNVVAFRDWIVQALGNSAPNGDDN